MSDKKITRRIFVKGTLGVSATLLLGAACSDDGDSGGASDGSDGGVLGGDTGNSSNGGADTGIGSNGVADTGTPDTGMPDTGVEDTGPIVTCDDPFEGGELLESVPFLEDEIAPFHVAYNRGHDGRLLTDLSVVEPGVSSIRNDHFYIRTRYPDLLEHEPGDPWSIRLHGLVGEEKSILLSDLEEFIEPMGTFVLECSGNSRNGSFGLLSAAEWSGIPISRLFDMVDIDPSAVGVEVTGFDMHSTVSTHSRQGASWIYTFAQLEEAGAFLATHMNGVPVPPDHGQPVRLYSPNWYGCCCIKWLDDIRFVGADEPPTAQMVEFATRTHQPGGNSPPRLAKDFRPATMDQSAMPVRVEKWRVNNEILYRVIGIMWGGYNVTEALEIRFLDAESYVPVDVCPSQKDNEGWTVWVHAWKPAQTGEYTLHCRIADANVPTIRLDAGYYDRPVRISEV